MGQPVVHWELWSQDPEKVSDFYAKVFDWKINHIPEMDYRLVETGGEGGIMKPKEGPPTRQRGVLHPSRWIRAVLQRIQGSRRQVIVERQDDPEFALSARRSRLSGALRIWKRRLCG